MGWISQNPARLATPPAVERAKVRPPDVAQVARLLRTAAEEDTELGLFLRLAVVLGARRGELCALRWRHVDFDRGEVLVASSISYVAGQPLFEKDTKTHAERRVAVGADTLELLRAHRLRAAETALSVGATLAPDAFVFSHLPDGQAPIRPDSTSTAPTWASATPSATPSGSSSRRGPPMSRRPEGHFPVQQC